jgi:CHAT domain-containing protein
MSRSVFRIIDASGILSSIVVWTLIVWSLVVCANAQTRDTNTPAPPSAEEIAEHDQLWRTAQSLHAEGKPAEALAAGETCLAFARKVFGDEHPRLLPTLAWLAQRSLELGNRELAVVQARRLATISGKTLGESSEQAKFDRLRLAYFEKLANASADRFTSAIALEAKAHRLYAARDYQLATDRLDYQHALESYADKRRLVERYLDQREDRLRNESRFQETLDTLRELDRLRAEVLGPAHPFHAVTWFLIGDAYERLDRYEDAAPWFRKAWTSFQDTLGSNSVVTAQCCLLLAKCRYREAEFRDAARLLMLAAECYEAAGEHYVSAWVSGFQGDCYRRDGDDKAAIAAYLTSMQRFKAMVAPGRQGLAASLSHLAGLHIGIDDEDRPRHLYRFALAMQRVIGGPQMAYAASLSNLADVHRAQSDYRRAEPLYRESLEIAEKTFGREHPLTAINQANLGLLYAELGRPRDAEPLLRASCDVMRGWLDRMADNQSERQQLLSAEEYRVYLSAWLGVAYQCEIPVAERYERLLAWKGAVYAAQTERSALLKLPQAQGKWEQLRQVRQQIALVALSAPDRSAPDATQKLERQERQLAELTARQEALEVELSRQHAEFQSGKVARRMTVDELRARLPADCALLDFIEYQRPDDKAIELKQAARWEHRVGVFVVRRECELDWIDLGQVETVQQAVDEWRAVHGRASVQAKERTATGEALSRLLWRPMASLVGDARTVLVAPDGVLHAIPLGALPGPQPGSYLIEERAFAVVPVPQVIGTWLEQPDAAPGIAAEPPSLLVFAEVDYGAAPGPINPALAANDERRLARAAGDDRGGPLKFPSLANARAELLSVSDSFSRSFDQKAKEYRGKQATEAALRQHAPGNRYIHLVTHGFFAPESVRSILDRHVATRQGPEEGNYFSLERMTYALGKRSVHRTVAGFHPGLLSGIALAGANVPAQPGQDDGIHTALEVSALDLRTTELVVLSACETGLGKVAGGEGTLGLQRAFHQAGARTTVASLWNVSDRTTMLLMSRFYENLWGKKLPKLEALREAQLWLMRDQESRGASPETVEAAEPLPPYHWAAWVLSGDWR